MGASCVIQAQATHQITADELLGIERPKLRRGSAIANQNTLIYVLINLHALQRVRARKAALARQAVTAAPPR